jgi:predicted metal-dependent hydrolase
MARYKSQVTVSGKTIRYIVSTRSRLNAPKMRYGTEGLEVIVPETYGSSTVEKYIRDNAEWILSHENGTPAEGRTQEEFEALARALTTRFYHMSEISKEENAAIPAIRFRQMKTVAAGYDSEKNVLTFSRMLTSSSKEAITMVSAYGIALMSGKPGTEQFGRELNKLCPDWRKIRSALPDTMKLSFGRS